MEEVLSLDLTVDRGEGGLRQTGAESPFTDWGMSEFLSRALEGDSTWAKSHRKTGHRVGGCWPRLGPDCKPFQLPKTWEVTAERTAG